MEQLSERLERIGTTRDDIERDDAGAWTMEGREKLVKTRASKGIGNTLIVCNRAVKWWYETVKKAIRARIKSRERQTDIE